MGPEPILLVDDEEDVRLIASLCLTRVAGWEVVQAASGQEALSKARQSRFSLVLMDVQMPGMSGDETLPPLRELIGETTPVIFMTAGADDAECARLERLGAAGVIGKPFDPMKLADRIRALLGTSVD